MCELQFGKLYRLRKGKARRKGEEEFKPTVLKVHNTRADMFYCQWTDEIYINAFFTCDEYDKKYPFHSKMLEDDTESILAHEAIHQALNNIAGWTAAKYFDKICPHWALKYWSNPP